MSAEYLVKRIRKEFPELEWDRYRYIDDGAEHEVIILDERWVFRIPWGYQDELTNEIACLNYLANRVEAGIPIYQYVSRDECLGGYEFLAGKQLMQEHCESLTTADREHVAELLAGLLGDLHKTPLDDVEAFNVPHASKPGLDKATLDSLSSLLGSTVVKA